METLQCYTPRTDGKGAKNLILRLLIIAAAAAAAARYVVLRRLRRERNSKIGGVESDLSISRLLLETLMAVCLSLFPFLPSLLSEAGERASERWRPNCNGFESKEGGSPPRARRAQTNDGDDDGNGLPKKYGNKNSEELIEDSFLWQWFNFCIFRATLWRQEITGCGKIWRLRRGQITVCS